MNYEQYTCLPESEGDCLPTLSSDTNPSLPLSGTNTPAKSCASEPPMDGSLICQCGKGTFDCSIHPNTRGEWIASMQDSLAKILASLESRPDLEKALAAGFTEKSCESLAWYDRDTSSWRTSQRSFLTGWEPYSETWPRWGMTADGSAFAHPMSALRMGAIDGLPLQLWLTPRANESGEGNETFIKRMGDRTDSCASSLSAQVLNPKTHPKVKIRQIWATPNTMDSLPSRSYEAMKRQATNGGRKNRSRPGNLREQIDPLMCQAYDESKAEANAGTVSNMQMWPTPSAHNAKETGAPSQMERNTVQLGDMMGGRLSPRFVEWLMGVPINFTKLRAGGKSSQTSDE